MDLEEVGDGWTTTPEDSLCVCDRSRCLSISIQQNALLKAHANQVTGYSEYEVKLRMAQLAFWKAKGKSERQARFKNVLELARDISQRDPGGLTSLVRLVTRPLQARGLSSAAFSAEHEALDAYTFSTLFFIDALVVTPDGKRAHELIGHPDTRYGLRLAVDPVLPVPWLRPRVASALATIGFGRSQGDWSYDASNHFATLVLPFGIALVNGGNHSITAGIVNGEGVVETTQVDDLSRLYDYVHYDGSSFVRTHDGQELGTPRDEEPGMLFEIGRLMNQLGVRYDACLIGSDVAREPHLSGGDGYYSVVIDGRDAGVALTASGATRALRKVGLAEGSEEWTRVISGNTSFSRKNYGGSEEEIRLVWRVRRRVVDDLDSVYDVMPWVRDDDD